MTEKTWHVAEEFNDAAHKKLGNVLRQLGFKIDKKWNASAGSQDIGHWEVSSPEGRLVIESETYIGLNVTGKSSLVNKVKKAYSLKP